MAQNPPVDETGPPADPVALGDTPLPVGHFRFYFADELWEWSPETAELHGYPAVEMRPTTEQVMSHKHPEDRDRMADVLDHVRRTKAALSTRHRIVDVQGNSHDVIAVGRQLCDQDGNVIGNEGFYVDVTRSPAAATTGEALEDAVTHRVADIMAGRTVIDEVKGMLMLVYRIDGQRAFDLLRWRSMVTNTKLRVFAEQLRDEFAALDYDETVPPRSVFDGVILTAHDRVGSPPQET